MSPSEPPTIERITQPPPPGTVITSVVTVRRPPPKAELASSAATWTQRPACLLFAAGKGPSLSFFFLSFTSPSARRASVRARPAQRQQVGAHRLDLPLLIAAQHLWERVL